MEKNQKVIGVSSDADGIPTFFIGTANSNEKRTEDKKRLTRLYIQRFYIEKSLERPKNWRNM